MANEENWKDQIVRAYVTELQAQKIEKEFEDKQANKVLEDEVSSVMSAVLGDCLDEAKDGNNYSKTYLIRTEEIEYKIVPPAVQVSDPAVKPYSEKLANLTAHLHVTHHLFSEYGEIGTYLNARARNYSLSIVGVAKLVFEELTRKQLSPKVVYDDSILKYYICSTWEEELINKEESNTEGNNE